MLQYKPFADEKYCNLGHPLVSIEEFRCLYIAYFQWSVNNLQYKSKLLYDNYPTLGLMYVVLKTVRLQWSHWSAAEMKHLFFALTAGRLFASCFANFNLIP